MFRAASVRVLTSVLVVLLVAVAFPVCADTTIRVGYLKEPFNINVVKLSDALDKSTRVELVQFRQFAEVGRALQANEIDVAAFGYQNVGIYLDAGFTDFAVVSGISSGGQNITAAKGVSLKTWSDLVNRKIGVPPNSFVELRLKASLKKAGVNLKDVNFVSFPGAGPPLLAALKNKDVDAMAVWEPLGAQAAADGFGDLAPLDLTLTETGGVTSVLGVRRTWADAHRDVVRGVVAALVKSTERLTKDRALWKSGVIEVTGLKPEVADLTMARGVMDYRLQQKQGQAVLRTLAEAGLMKADHSEAAVKHYDFSYLEAVTGKRKSDLGG